MANLPFFSAVLTLERATTAPVVDEAQQWGEIGVFRGAETSAGDECRQGAARTGATCTVTKHASAIVALGITAGDRIVWEGCALNVRGVRAAEHPMLAEITVECSEGASHNCGDE